MRGIEISLCSRTGKTKDLERVEVGEEAMGGRCGRVVPGVWCVEVREIYGVRRRGYDRGDRTRPTTVSEDRPEKGYTTGSVGVR